jgi:hypothetical protein
MRDLMAELKELRLHGMAQAWEELAAQGEVSTASSKWLLEHLLQQEQADRAVRSVNHQMYMAKLPIHRDLAGVDFSASSADARLVKELSSLEFTETAQNIVFIGGPGTGKHTWPVPWPCPESPLITNEYGSSPRSISSTCWSVKSTMVRQAESPRDCFGQTW